MSKRMEKTVSGLPVMWESKGGNIVVMWSPSEPLEKLSHTENLCMTESKTCNGNFDTESA